MSLRPSRAQPEGLVEVAARSPRRSSSTMARIASSSLLDLAPQAPPATYHEFLTRDTRRSPLSTKLLMTTSAAVTAVIGVALAFAPAEILAYSGSAPNPALSVLLQVAGAAFLGFAILDWMARASVIGGIYNRPLALGN